MYTNSRLEIINDNDAYTDKNGVMYPYNYPKNEIAGLYPVIETPQPTGDIVITGFHIDETHTQVWDYREKTTEELSEEKRQSILNDISALESKITPRRIREALLSGDNSFIEAIESQISELRAQLV